jgi:endonuclease/exonuclease/phosphatase family metal-dependent hydrolase
MSALFRFRVVSYNIHKCRGLDGRTAPERILSILHALDADILCLQEVVNAPGSSPLRSPLHDQAGIIERALPGHRSVFGANRPLHGGTYGSMTLTRLPVLSHRNHNITHRREERGALQTDLQLPSGHVLHLFNIHLGTMPHERHAQAKLLLGPAILTQPNLTGPRLVIGDFNEWTQGLTTRLLRSTFQSTRPRIGRLRHSFPGLLPVFTLDHCYYEPPLTLESTALFRSRTALIASDHLPLIADFTLAPDASIDL